MEIRFASSLTPEDEDRFAAALLRAIGLLLELVPIAYSVRIETSSGKTLDLTHSPLGIAEGPEPRLSEAIRPGPA